MAAPVLVKPHPTAPPLVIVLIDEFLDWYPKHRAPDTYRWYKDRLQSFCKTIEPALTADQLRPIIKRSLSRPARLHRFEFRPQVIERFKKCLVQINRIVGIFSRDVLHRRMCRVVTQKLQLLRPLQ
jgi:hypothetical protein